MKLLKNILIPAFVASLGFAALQHWRLQQSRETNRSLKLELAHAAAPRMYAASNAATAPITAPSTEVLRARGQLATLRGQKAEAGQLSEDNEKLRLHRFKDLLQGDRLKPAEVAAYLQAKQRSADSLLAAHKATGDLALLREAKEKNPADPRIQFALYSSQRAEMSPDERRACLDIMKQSALDNALPVYLSARDFFNSGQPSQAIQELTKAAACPKFDDYSVDAMRDAEEVYASAGFSDLEAKWLSTSSASFNQLAELKGLGRNLADLAESYKKTGDDTSAQAALQMASALGQRIDNPSAKSTLIQELVGLAIEKSVLSGLNPSVPFDTSGRTAQQRLDEINQRRQAIKALTTEDFSASIQTLPAPDQLEYLERLKTSGEFAALTWAKSRQNKP